MKSLLVLSIAALFSLSIQGVNAAEPQYYKGGANKTPTYVKQLNLDSNQFFADSLANAITIDPAQTDNCYEMKIQNAANSATLTNEEMQKLHSECEVDALKTLWSQSQYRDHRFFNILILGLDVPTRPRGYLTLDKIKKIPILSSRSDSINILSLDLLTGKHVLFSIYRGIVPVESCWGQTRIPEAESDRIITNLFTLGKRVDFIQCVRDQMRANLMSNEKLEGYRERIINDRFPIHATLEIDVSSFKSAMTEILSVAISNLGTFNKIRESSGISLDDMKQLPGVVDAMRNRHDWQASGYQRAFNHAKFLTYSLGYVGKTLSIDPNFMSELTEIFRYLSSSLSLEEFSQLLALPAIKDQQLARLSDTLRFGQTQINGSGTRFVSPIDICEFGPGHSALLYVGGKRKVVSAGNGTGFLGSVQTHWIAIPNPESHENSPFLEHTKGRVLPE